MTDPVFVFIHGAWHDKSTWDLVIPHLEQAGASTVTFDMPGAGVNAKEPQSYFERPLDKQKFATEPSPNAGTTQEERDAFVLAQIEQAAGKDGKVILVGHSLGGVTVSSVAEQAPEKIAAAVYLCAFMLTPGRPAVDQIHHQTMAGELVAANFMADPKVVGAMRLDFKSPDPDYRAALRKGYYGDLTDEQFETMLATLHCDEPASVAARPSPVTKERFGQVPRAYIRCTEDYAIPIAGQDYMIAEMDKAMGNETATYTLAASHSPFYSLPRELADILLEVARSV